MEAQHQGSSRDLNEDPVAIGSATSVEEILGALARRGCSNLTSSIDLTACSDFPCAQGGFCDVYRGVLDDDTGIAIKVLRVYEDSARVRILKRAARELYHWSKLHHCNVLPLLGLTVFRERISLVSRWMENGNLMSYIKRRPDANRVKLCMDICAGLCYIHTNGMVHGDLKAANIMVSSAGTALIADFGNAELRDLTLRFTNTSKFDVSIRWAAPELLVPKGAPQASKQADVYAFGMTILETLTGKVPFHGINDYRIPCLVARKGEVPPRPDIDIRDDLWSILNWCWTREPTKRPGIASIENRLHALFQPPFDTWSTKDITPRPQEGESNSRRGTGAGGAVPGAHERPLGVTRKLPAGGDDEEGEKELVQRHGWFKTNEQNEYYYSGEEEEESESEEGEDVEEQEESVEKETDAPAPAALTMASFTTITSIAPVVQAQHAPSEALMGLGRRAVHVETSSDLESDSEEAWTDVEMDSEDTLALGANEAGRQQSILVPPEPLPPPIQRTGLRTNLMNPDPRMYPQAALPQHNLAQNLAAARRGAPTVLQTRLQEQLEGDVDGDRMDVRPIHSPRTVRRKMLAEELTESLRRNLMWERTSARFAMGPGLSVVG